MLSPEGYCHIFSFADVLRKVLAPAAQHFHVVSVDLIVVGVEPKMVVISKLKDAV